MKSNISTVVGTLQEDWKFWRKNVDETFYFVHINIEDYIIPVVMSQHFFNKYKGKRVAADVFPRETRIKFNGKRQVFSYLYCVHIEEVTENIEELADCRDVEIEGVVASRDNKVQLGGENTSKIHFEMEFVVNFDRPVKVLVPCRAFGSTARALIDIRKGDRLAVSGKISGSNQTLRLVIKRFEYIEEEVEVDVV